MNQNKCLRLLPNQLLLWLLLTKVKKMKDLPCGCAQLETKAEKKGAHQYFEANNKKKHYVC